MKRTLFVLSLTLLTVAVWAADPVVDGKVAAGEYAQTKAILGGKASLNWSPDGAGGLFVAVVAPTKGWVAVGFGSARMDGAYIYIGFLGDDGKPVFSEQAGKGHRHSDAGKVTVDKSSVARQGSATVLEFHIAAGKLPFSGKTVPYIAAFGDEANLRSYHDDNREGGSITLP